MKKSNLILYITMVLLVILVVPTYPFFNSSFFKEKTENDNIKKSNSFIKKVSEKGEDLEIKRIEEKTMVKIKLDGWIPKSYLKHKVKKQNSKEKNSYLKKLNEFYIPFLKKVWIQLLGTIIILIISYIKTREKSHPYHDNKEMSILIILLFIMVFVFNCGSYYIGNENSIKYLFDTLVAFLVFIALMKAVNVDAKEDIIYKIILPSVINGFAVFSLSWDITLITIWEGLYISFIAIAIAFKGPEINKNRITINLNQEFKNKLSSIISKEEISKEKFLERCIEEKFDKDDD